MRTTPTFKHVLISGLLLMAGAFGALAQENAGAVTATAGTYRLDVPKTLIGGSDVTVTPPGGGVGISPVYENKENSITYTVDVPAGTPLDGSISVILNGTPMWHVTVADILGSDNSEPGGVMLRPMVIDGGASGTTTGTGTTSSAIAGAPSGPATSGSGGNTPKMDIYPNPAVDDIIIVTEGEVLWGVTEVIDLTGKKIMEVPTGSSSPAAGTNRVSFGVSSLKPGIYFVRVRVGSEIQTKRFQVSR